MNSANDYLFGGRSFTIYEVNKNGIEEVFSSKDDFESITAELLPEYFNCSNDDMTIDDRSGKKGPEPESVTVGKADGKTYAFVALERIGGIMAYDISDPENAEYAGYINSREFTADIAGDVAPEGLAYISAKDSPNGRNLLLVACEVSGTVAVYAIGDEVYVPEDDESSGRSYSLENTTGTTTYFKVEFDTDGGSDIRSIRVKKNTALEDIDIPVKGGYIFGGWYTDKDCTDKFTADTKIKSDMTLYAKWIKDASSDSASYSIILTVGSNEAKVWGNTVVNDVAPVIRNDRVMLPARFVAEGLGAEVKWSQDEPNKIIITKENTEIVITIGSNTAVVNGETVVLDSAAFIENDRTYLPIRFICESLGAEVSWNETEQKVYIKK